MLLGGTRGATRTPGQRHFRRPDNGRHRAARRQCRRDATGEGKTLVATLPLLYLERAGSAGVHFVTVNDTWRASVPASMALPTISLGCDHGV